MINMIALKKLLDSHGITPRIEYPSTGSGEWPTLKKGEQVLAQSYDENGRAVVVFIPRVV